MLKKQAKSEIMSSLYKYTIIMANYANKLKIEELTNYLETIHSKMWKSKLVKLVSHIHQCSVQIRS